jgi:hypothetical protein
VTDAQLVKVMREHKIVFPKNTLEAARKTGLGLRYACALLDLETGGGRNVFGHDPTPSIPKRWQGKEVWLVRYRYYKRRRGQHGMQGVGPTQLTWWQYQDRADALGGCHKPFCNMQVGFSILRALIRQHGVQHGAARFNGTGEAAERYGRNFLIHADHWGGRFTLGGAALDEEPFTFGPTDGDEELLALLPPEGHV